MKKVAILQSNYIPWKGYFDMIAYVDEFILYDSVQYTRRDWRNRNQIKTPQGTIWLTVPVQTKGKQTQLICDTKIDGHSWQADHWKTLTWNYKKTPYFNEISSWLEPLYKQEYNFLSDMNRNFIVAICSYLGINTKLTNSRDYTLSQGKTEKLIDLCIQAAANEYVSGPLAKGYFNEQYALENGITVSWFNYDGYPKYPQLWGDFTHNVSILDLLFNCGKESKKYMRYV